jgi:hypothetical protein
LLATLVSPTGPASYLHRGEGGVLISDGLRQTPPQDGSVQRSLYHHITDDLRLSFKVIFGTLESFSTSASELNALAAGTLMVARDVGR